jgi:demethylmenaquinone methyltransferase/2-methoxy-6-polyprenyl-1,4-benzoquinol methylase
MGFLDWTDYEIPFIRKRYNRIHRYYRLFEWIYALPPGIRPKTIARLELKPGDRVLEIGCGTGRNLALLRDAVGEDGRVYGVDLSEGMLGEARALCDEHGWTNVELSNKDVLEYTPGEAVDGILFSLSYATMPEHKQILARAWSFLQPDRHVVIMDAKLPEGVVGKLLLPSTLWMMRRTVLGNPYIRPWEDLRKLTSEVTMEQLQFGTYYICRGTKRCPASHQYFPGGHDE